MNDFTIKLGALTNGKNSFSFDIKDQFFEAFTMSDVECAEIKAIAILDKDGAKIKLRLTIEGLVNNLPCDICTDEISVNINAQTNVIIKVTDEDLASTDEIFYIKKSENQIDLKQLIFEMIILTLPKRRQHPLDENGQSTCNKEMVDLVNKYTEIKEKSSDSRWDVLKDLKIT